MCAEHQIMGKRAWLVFAGMAALTSSLVPYLFAFFGLDLTDTPYHLVKAPYYLAHPATVLSYHLIATWQAWGGHSVLASRLTAVALLQVAAAGLLLFATGKAERRIALLAYVGFNLLLCGQAATTLNYDTLSLCLLLSAFCALFAYQKSGYSRACLIGAAALSALSVPARLPNIVVFPGVALWLCGLAYFRQADRRKAVLDVLLYAAVFFGVLTCVFAAYYPSLNDALQAYRPNSSARGVAGLLLRYFRDALRCLGWAGVLNLFATCFGELVKGKQRTVWLLACAGCFSACLFWMLFFELKMYWYEQVYLLAGLLFCQIAAVLYDLCKKGGADYREGLLLWGVLLFAAIPVAGSDTGLMKLATAFFVPFMLVRYWRHYAVSFRWVFLCVLVALSVYTPVQRLKLQYEDLGMLRTWSAVSHPLLSGVRTTALRKTYLEAVIADVRSSAAPTIFVGRVRHIFDYVFEQDGLYSANFWSSLENDDYVGDVERSLGGQGIRTVFLVPGYPEWGVQGAGKMESMLTRRGYALRKDASTYRIYVKGE